MDRRIRSTIELLNRDSDGRISLSDLARRVGLGPSRLSHLFKTHLNVTIRDFVRERRLTRAAELLATTEERVSIICSLIGFRDVPNFNHAFKRHFGVTPREYRRVRDDKVSESNQEKAEDTKN
jgi:AraC family transcriptional regulator, arabinose operon regulatory protein